MGTIFPGIIVTRHCPLVQQVRGLRQKTSILGGAEKRTNRGRAQSHISIARRSKGHKTGCARPAHTMTSLPNSFDSRNDLQPAQEGPQPPQNSNPSRQDEADITGISPSLSIDESKGVYCSYKGYNRFDPVNKAFIKFDPASPTPSAVVAGIAQADLVRGRNLRLRLKSEAFEKRWVHCRNGDLGGWRVAAGLWGSHVAHARNARDGRVPDRGGRQQH